MPLTSIRPPRARDPWLKDEVLRSILDTLHSTFEAQRSAMESPHDDGTMP
jgi:hypothetical protein